jgi:1,2-phenylacetyl-CoA epoxidase catalytic subunit
MSVVERVARAMFMAHGPDGRRYWGEDPEKEWLTYVPDARAAIAAMRVATDEMMQAGMNVGAFPMCHGEVEVRYQAMIDAALAE